MEKERHAKIHKNQETDSYIKEQTLLQKGLLCHLPPHNRPLRNEKKQTLNESICFGNYNKGRKNKTSQKFINLASFSQSLLALRRPEGLEVKASFLLPRGQDIPAANLAIMAT